MKFYYDIIQPEHPNSDLKACCRCSSTTKPTSQDGEPPADHEYADVRELALRLQTHLI